MSLYELPPGQAVCPYHYEYADEEWAMALDGHLTLRDPDANPTEPGDTIEEIVIYER